MAERITGHTQLVSLLAYPIRHSNSPAMQNEAFAYEGLDYAYLVFEVGTSDTEEGQEQELKDAITEALAEVREGRGYVVDCAVAQSELVRPMVNGGTHITEFLLN